MEDYTMNENIRTVKKLSNGVEIPVLGLGVWQVDDESQLRTSCKAALDAGYWHIDTAAAYNNEDMVGRAVADYGIRKDIFITTKLWNNDHANAEAAFELSLKKLQTDYVDLYLIHWPAPKKYDNYVAAWKSLVEIYKSGRAKAIGVSNFHRHHIEKIIDATGVAPHMNQVERHILFQQKEIAEYCKSLGTAMTAYSPLGSGRLAEVAPNVQPLADKHGKSVAQVLLRWHLQTGWVLIPKSVTPARVLENSQIFDFELDGSDMDFLSAIDCNVRYLPDSDEAEF
jgi:diketogulonate reductase-like aldo/keto reductase